MLRRVVPSLLFVLLVAACGGGTQSDPFIATRVIAFGDELSALEDSGDANARKYTVNALRSDGTTLSCQLNPLWIQTLAGAYGITFPQCNPNAVTNPTGRIYAAAGARVADIAGQIDTHLAGGTGFKEDDLVTVLAGMNDLFDLYAQFPTTDAATLIAQAEAAGAALGRQVVRVAEAGGKVLIATVPDLGLTPYAIAQEAAFPGEGRKALLTQLSARFNAKLRTTLPNDSGRSIGLVLLNELIQAIVRTPIGWANVIAPVCNTATQADVRTCTTLTLVTDGSSATWLWASDRLLSPAGQAQLGTAAFNQSRRNPF